MYVVVWREKRIIENRERTYCESVLFSKIENSKSSID